MISERADDLAAVAEGVCAVLEGRGAGVIPRGESSLLEHLLGVHAILDTWCAPRDVTLGGLVYSAYGPSDGRSLFSVDERDAVRDLAGSAAERLAFLAHSVEREELWHILGTEPSLPQRLKIPSRDGSPPLEVTQADLRGLLLIQLAAAAEEERESRGLPAPWLSRAAPIAKLLSTGDDIFASVARISAADEDVLLSAYTAAWGDPSEQNRSAVKAAIAAVPFLAEPHIVLGLWALAGSRLDEAARCSALACSMLHRFGAAWDKRLQPETWLSIALFIQQAATAPPREAAFLSATIGRMLAAGPTPETIAVKLNAMELLPRAQESAAVSATECDVTAPAADDIFCPEDFNQIPDRFLDFLDGLRSHNPQRALSIYPGLTARPWWDPSDFPLVRELESCAEEIAREFAAIDRRSLHPESEDIQRGGNWDVFLLFERGRKREERCAAVPVATRIIEQHATLRTHAGLVYFSRLGPGAIVAPHRGPTNVRLRCHLGIRIPNGCGISVDGVTRTWEQGKCIVFDDSYTHSVWNSSEEERVVLIVDIWHPELIEEERLLLSGLHLYGLSVGRGLAEYWQKNDDAAIVATT